MRRRGAGPARAAAASGVALVAALAGTAAPAEPPAAAARIAEGKTIFRSYCWGCHGLSGRGDGPMAKALELPTPDFRSPSFRWDTDGDGVAGTAADLRDVVTHGVPRYRPECAEILASDAPPGGCAMQGWGEVFRAEQVEAVVAYVRSLDRRGGRSRSDAPAP